ncbi:PPE domain-containing protein [Saccharothrix syringae]|uniref:PPE domain-containing protein n=1 Tax=Saccharothrix syringae TaxID=103733 RepID=A0A5Q0HAJ5_SACSY|nr:PPE domain-containing protein [Saccharothrix syringae]QFZ23266.1 PPE domain-containing protein [Saccharothrix syringae]
MPDGHRWNGYSHEELYERIHSGPGPGASHASVERWAGVSAALTEINAELHAGVMRSGAKWEGDAAERARMGINPLAAWADEARGGADVMRVSAELQADYIAKARADMPAPVPVTAEKPNVVVGLLTALVGGQTDYEQQEQARDAAEQRAREVMATYASSTTSNTSTLGQFHQPPQLVISAPDVVRNDAAGVSGPGWALGGPRGGRGRWGGRGRYGGGRGVRGTTPGYRSTPAPGGTTGTTGTSSAGGTRTSSASPSAPAHAPTTGPTTGAYGPGGVLGGSQDRRRSSSSSGSSEQGAVTPDTTEQQSSAQQHGGAGGAEHRLPVGTTSVSSAEFGAFAANAQHAAVAGPGGSAGPMTGGTGQAGNNDTVHKRTVGVAPAQQAFDPFGGLGAARGGEEEEDRTHDAADYLRETDDIYGIGGFSPPVIGESTTL